MLQKIDIYEKALKIIRHSNEMYDALENIGINLDFDDNKKAAGKMFQILANNPKDIACYALNMTLRTETGYCHGVDEKHLFPIQVDSYYPKDGNVEFSITEECMYDLLDKASKDEDCAALVWDCFYNRHEDAKELLKTKYDVYGFGESL